MKKINTLFLALIIGLLSVTVFSSVSFAADPIHTVPEEQTSAKRSACEGTGGTWAYKNKSDGSPNTASSERECRGTAGGRLDTFIKQIINVLLFIAGMVAVIMIIIGGLRYITSDGDSSRITQAKQTVLYAIIGLVVAILAYAIVNFVISNL